MRFLVLFSLVVALLAGIHYSVIHYVDPYGEFSSGRYPVVVLDSRRAKSQLLLRFRRQGSVDGLILGSSRSLLMRPALLGAAGTTRVFNFAVDNAHAEDFLAIFHYGMAHGVLPKFLVIGLDVPSLQSDDRRDHMFDRSELKNYLDPSAGAAADWSILQKVNEIKSIYTRDYLKDAFRAVLMDAQRRTPRTRFGPDGYEEQYSGAQLPTGDINGAHDFSEDTQSYLQRISGMHDLSPKRLAYLRQLFAEARQNHVKVVVWLTPIHPRLYELVAGQSNYADLVDRVNAVARTWVSESGILYRDYSDIRKFEGLATAWADATHMDWRNMDRVAGALAGEVRSGI